MFMAFRFAILSLIAVLCAGQAAANQTFSSGPQRVSLLELYTSQGCSSCPPVENWFSHLTDDQELWSRLVPVSFHVTYWDSLGWTDSFGDALYDFRQRTYAKVWRNRSGVYTPGVVLNGEEWRGWMRRGQLELPALQSAGDLRIELSPSGIAAGFVPMSVVSPNLRLNLALLGFGISSNIKSGENAGQTLHHDFVVLAYRQGTLKASGGRYQGFYGALKAESGTASRLALAAWVSGPDDPSPLQAVGGWLTADATEAAPTARTVAPSPSHTAGKGKAR